MLLNKIKIPDLLETEYFDKFLKVAGFSNVRNFENLGNVLAAYKKKLKRSRNNLSFILNSGETYVEKVEIDSNNYYYIAWNIASVKKTIQKHDFPCSRLDLTKVFKAVEKNCINESRLSYSLHNDKPIIIASYPQLTNRQRFVVIDGNHRITARFRDGQKEINGILLSPTYHMPGMVGDFHRTIFKIHHNMYMIASFVGGNIEKDVLEKSLYII